jgi:hypothetical protein
VAASPAAHAGDGTHPHVRHGIGIATALLAGPWSRRTMVRRSRSPSASPGYPAGWETRGHDPATFREHVLGRVAWAAALDPVLGARLHALAREVDWG